MSRLVSLLSLLVLLASTDLHATSYPARLGKVQSGQQPYTLIGQLYFANGGSDYIGSGVVIRPRSILTAGHNLYDPDNGWSTDLLFRRGAYGNTTRAQQYGQKIYLLGGYRQSANYYGSSSVRTFASDTGGVLFRKALANGASANWVAKPSMLTDSNRYRIAIGYGAEGQHTGDYPLFVVPDKAFYSAWNSFYESRGAAFEGGMSGGPVFAASNNGLLYVTALVVSGSDYPYVSGGIRVIDSAISSFIWSYLR